MHKASLANLIEGPDCEHCHLLMRTSFEARSTAIARALPYGNWESVVAFKSKDLSNSASLQIVTLKDHFRCSLAFHELDTRSPLEAARVMKSALDEFQKMAGGKKAILDITSFRREELLMLMAMLSEINRDVKKQWSLAYVSAGNMGEWLSGKVTSIRSILGFPGEIWPSRPTCLVILMGFEVNRTRSIIEAYEPKKIYLGMGHQNDSISAELYNRNKELVDSLALDLKIDDNSRFEFSARNPKKVGNEISNIFQVESESNFVIAPLNTKLSTIGVGLYALSHPRIQVCYAAVDEYNEEAYSALGGDVYFVSLNEIQY
jgi:hypothetical protein